MQAAKPDGGEPVGNANSIHELFGIMDRLDGRIHLVE
jgi:hypothetical protein